MNCINRAQTASKNIVLIYFITFISSTIDPSPSRVSPLVLNIFTPPSLAFPCGFKGASKSRDTYSENDYRLRYNGCLRETTCYPLAAAWNEVSPCEGCQMQSSTKCVNNSFFYISSPIQHSISISSWPHITLGRTMFVARSALIHPQQKAPPTSLSSQHFPNNLPSTERRTPGSVH